MEDHPLLNDNNVSPTLSQTTELLATRVYRKDV